MDKVDKKDWSWIKQHLPGVVVLLAEYREFGEGAHIDECWKRGVMGGQPGWFFAREGPVCLGTPFDDKASPILCDIAVRDWRRAGLVLMLAPLPGGGECRRLNDNEKRAREIVDLDAQGRRPQRHGLTGEVVHGAH